MQKTTRIFSLILLGIELCGCAVISTEVTTIGARSIHGKAKVESPNTADIDLYDSELYLSAALIAHINIVPYSSPLYAEDKGTYIENINLDMNSVRWSDDNKGEAIIKVLGEHKVFSVQKHFIEESTVEIISHYHRWYWYPAQALQVVALPADLAVNAGLILVVGPALYIYDSVTR